MSIESRLKKISDAIKPNKEECFGVVAFNKGEANKEALLRTKKETGGKQCDFVIFKPDIPNI